MHELARYEELWSTDQYVLVENNNSPKRPYEIKDRQTGFNLKIEEDNIYSVVINHMLEANVDILSEWVEPKINSITSRNIQEFSYLWEEGRRSKYALIASPEQNNMIKYIIYDTKSGVALLIEDNDVYLAIVEKMINYSVKIYSELPSDRVRVPSSKLLSRLLSLFFNNK